MKPIYWVFIGVGFTLGLLAIVIFIPVVWLNRSAWWIWGVLIFEAIVWAMIGIIFLFIRIRKKPEVKEKIDLSDAKKRAIYDVRFDEDNPDNFKVDSKILFRVGDKNKDPTPVAWLSGVGTEMKNRIDVLINLNNPKKEILRFDNSNDLEVKEIARTFAENPEDKIFSETKQTRDEYGNPTVITKVVKSSSIDKKEQEEKEKAEKAQAL